MTAVVNAAPAAAAAHFDLEDMFGMAPANSSKQQHAAAPAAPAAADHHDDPFAAFGTVEGASAAIPAATPPAAPAAAVSPAAAAAGSGRTTSPSRQEAAARAKAAAAAAAAAAAVTSPRDHSPRYQSYQQQQQQQPSRAPDPARQVDDPYSSGRRQEAPSFSTLAAERAYGVESVDGGGGHDRGQGLYGGPDGSFSGGSLGGSATGGKGWGGLLKSVTKTATTLGKKGLKAAQVGGCACSNVGWCVSVGAYCLPASLASMIQLISLHGLQACTGVL